MATLQHRLTGYFKQIVDGLYLFVFQYAAAVNFNWQLVQTGSAERLILNFLAFVKSKIRIIILRQDGATLFDKIDDFRLNSNVQNKIALKCAKSQRNRLRRFEDVSRKCVQSNVVAAPVFGPPCRLYGITIHRVLY